MFGDLNDYMLINLTLTYIFHRNLNFHWKIFKYNICDIFSYIRRIHFVTSHSSVNQNRNSKHLGKTKKELRTGSHCVYTETGYSKNMYLNVSLTSISDEFSSMEE